MIYEIIATVFLALSLFFVFGYFVVALSNEIRIRKIRETTKRDQFMDALIGKKRIDKEDIDYPEYDESDMLSLVTVLDYTTDNTIRNNIKKGIEILMERKRG